MGYSGGRKPNPTYKSILDHTEAVLVEFDPNIITYEELVIEWSRMHQPTGRRSCQYRSAVWYLDEEQKEICKEVVDGLRATYGNELATDVERATRFYKAEEYHQNFTEKMMKGRGRW